MFLQACTPSFILGISKEEALERIRAGSLNFILAQPVEDIIQLRWLGPEIVFYVGLQLQAQKEEERAIILFEEALKSASPLIRGEAYEVLFSSLWKQKERHAQKLTSLIERFIQEKEYFRPALCEVAAEISFSLGNLTNMEKLVQKIPEEHRSDHLKALILLKEIEKSSKENLTLQNTQKVPPPLEETFKAYFLAAPFTTEHQKTFKFIITTYPSLLPSLIKNIAQARSLVLDRSYGEALVYFKRAMEENKEAIFFWPEVLSDLGKAYQYGTALQEGIERFSLWEQDIARKTLIGEQGLPGDKAKDSLKNNSLATPTNGVNREIDPLRFRLLFYLGRMYRQKQDFLKSLEYFQRSIAFAESPVQRDAAIWYLLDTVLTIQTENIPLYLDKYIPLWYSASYYQDLLDRTCTILVTRNSWNVLHQVFQRAYQFLESPLRARYAYILGRSIEEGYYIPKQPLSFSHLPEIHTDLRPATFFFKIAYESDRASFYYRSLAAAHLGTQLELVTTSSREEPNRTEERTEDLYQFLRGFFDYGATKLALPFILKYEKELPLTRLRQLAQLLAQEERWWEGIRLISRFSFRENYTPIREDLFLLYPRPYSSIIDTVARSLGVPPELMYGLIRTESAFAADAVSRAGAVGLTQLMPATALDAASRIARAGGPQFIQNGTVDLLNPEINIYIGTWYFKHLIERTGSPLLALASYNGGITRLRQWRNNTPAMVEDLFLETIPITETRQYARQVLAAAAVYGYLYFGMSMEQVITDIFPVNTKRLSSEELGREAE
ncbi:MAG: lytic transglycosylase domain-containing protein [Treponemataceae bacterium]|nr:lytic transglycosylase domain-containing protein [Treponemataceae bacterium]